MRLNDIFTVQGNEKLYKQYSEIWSNLKNKYGNDRGTIKRDDIFEEINSSNGYAKKMYSGKIKPGIELTELELSMVVDGGFSHFGGSSSIGKDGSFYVTIYTD